MSLPPWLFLFHSEMHVGCHPVHLQGCHRSWGTDGEALKPCISLAPPLRRETLKTTTGVLLVSHTPPVQKELRDLWVLPAVALAPLKPHILLSECKLPLHYLYAYKLSTCKNILHTSGLSRDLSFAPAKPSLQFGPTRPGVG